MVGGAVGQLQDHLEASGRDRRGMMSANQGVPRLRAVGGGGAGGRDGRLTTSRMFRTSSGQRCGGYPRWRERWDSSDSEVAAAGKAVE